MMNEKNHNQLIDNFNHVFRKLEDNSLKQFFLKKTYEAIYIKQLQFQIIQNEEITQDIKEFKSSFRSMKIQRAALLSYLRKQFSAELKMIANEWNQSLALEEILKNPNLLELKKENKEQECYQFCLERPEYHKYISHQFKTYTPPYYLFLQGSDIIGLLSLPLRSIYYGLKKIFDATKKIFRGQDLIRNISKLIMIGGSTYGGCVLGGMLGAIIGSVFPIIGTTIGGIVGTVLGGMIASGLGAVIGKQLIRGISFLINRKEINPTNPRRYKLSQEQKNKLNQNNFSENTLTSVLKMIYEEKGNSDSSRKTTLNADIEKIKNGELSSYKMDHKNKEYLIWLKQPTTGVNKADEVSKSDQSTLVLT